MTPIDRQLLNGIMKRTKRRKTRGRKRKRQSKLRSLKYVKLKLKRKKQGPKKTARQSWQLNSSPRQAKRKFTKKIRKIREVLRHECKRMKSSMTFHL